MKNFYPQEKSRINAIYVKLDTHTIQTIDDTCCPMKAKNGNTNVHYVVKFFTTEITLRIIKCSVVSIASFFVNENFV